MDTIVVDFEIREDIPNVQTVQLVRKFRDGEPIEEYPEFVGQEVFEQDEGYDSFDYERLFNQLSESIGVPVNLIEVGDIESIKIPWND